MQLNLFIAYLLSFTFLSFMAPSFSFALSPDITTPFPTREQQCSRPYDQPTKLPCRTAKNCDSPGNYELAVRVDNPVLKPGEKLGLQFYITGYGHIEGSHFQFFPPTHFISVDNSSVRYGLKQGADNALTYHACEDRISTIGFWLDLTPEMGYFCDRTSIPIADNHMIRSEIKSGSAPIEVSLQTVKDTPPGNYQLRFYFTYYNGREWRTSVAPVELKVQTLYEQNEFWLQKLIIFLTFIAVLPGLEIVYRVIRWFRDSF